MSGESIGPRSWQEITTEAAKEKDSAKLAVLVDELDRALAARDKVIRPTASDTKAKPAA